MGRRKIDIEYIRDDRSRATTFVKRKTGLFKKAHEFGVLTGTQIAVIIFNQQDKLFTYASDPVAQICARFLENPQAMEAKMPADFGMDDGDESDGDALPSPSQPASERRHSAAASAGAGSRARASSTASQTTLPPVDGRRASGSASARRSPIRQTGPANTGPSAIPPGLPLPTALAGLHSPMLLSPQTTSTRSPMSPTRPATPELERHANRKRPRARSPVKTEPSSGGGSSSGQFMQTGDSTGESSETTSGGHKYARHDGGGRHALSDIRDSPRKDAAGGRGSGRSASSTPPHNQQMDGPAQFGSASMQPGRAQMSLPSLPQGYANPLPQYRTQRANSLSSMAGSLQRSLFQQNESDHLAPMGSPSGSMDDLQKPIPLRGAPMGPPLIIPNQNLGPSSHGDAREGARLSATHLTQAPPLLLHPAGSGGSAGGPLSRALHPAEMTPIESPGGYVSALFGPGSGSSSGNSNLGSSNTSIGNGTGSLNGLGSQVTVPRISTDVGTLFYNWDKNEPGLSPATSFALNQMAPTPVESIRAAEQQRAANNTTPVNNGRPNAQVSAAAAGESGSGSGLPGGLGPGGFGDRPPISAGVLDTFSPTTRTWLRQHTFPDAPGKPA